MADTSPTLPTVLADRYRLQEEIGRGGMATVYLAHDEKHRRDVAVKVLRADLSASLGPDRFLREIEIAAQLQHPHILMLIDSGHKDDLLYYVMPLAEGGSLRDRLMQKRRCSTEEAISVVRPVADALTYAHRQGVVHRDIKPENILFSQNHPVVSDFGIAKAVTAGTDRLTRTGFPVGTPGYMSPEQAMASVDLDPTTDVFSLGVVFYEMVIGDIPAMWVADESVAVLRFLDAPDEHRRRLDRLSGTVEQALVKALALRREHRFESPNAFVGALMDQTDRRYATAEANAIIRRAANMEVERAPTESHALSLGGLQQIGAEVGIPPEQVRRAALAVDTAPNNAPRGWGRLLGANTRIHVERVVDGELPEIEFPALVEEIRTTLGAIGTVNAFGQAVTWHTAPSSGQMGREIHVMIAVRRGETRIRLEERLTQLAGGLFGGLLGGGGGAGGAVAGAALGEAGLVLAAIGAAIGVVGGVYGLARGIFTVSANNRRKQLERLADRLVEMAEDAL